LGKLLLVVAVGRFADPELAVALADDDPVMPAGSDVGALALLVVPLDSALVQPASATRVSTTADRIAGPSGFSVGRATVTKLKPKMFRVEVYSKTDECGPPAVDLGKLGGKYRVLLASGKSQPH